MSAALLQVDEIEFAYGSRPVLFGISIVVDAGESVALLGTNGAGKSTLLRVVAGLLHPTRGRVIFDGEDLARVPAEDLSKRGLVLVPGGEGVFRDLTVGENLEIQAVPLRRSRARTRERTDLVLATFPVLRSRLRQRAATLSGGEQQQLALAKALMLEPKLVCIDELSLGLSPVAVQSLMETVRSLHLGGAAVLLVEQSLNIASQLSRRSYFLEKGAVVFEGNTKDLLDNDEIARAVFLGGSARSAGGPRPPAR